MTGKSGVKQLSCPTSSLQWRLFARAGAGARPPGRLLPPHCPLHPITALSGRLSAVKMFKLMYVKSNLLNFFPCIRLEFYLFRQNVSASRGRSLPDPRPRLCLWIPLGDSMEPLQEPLPPFGSQLWQPGTATSRLMLYISGVKSSGDG